MPRLGGLHQSWADENYTMSDQPEIRFAIEQAFKQLETDKIIPWSFFSTGKMKPVEDFHCKIIRYIGSGLAFDGSPRLVFWEFIQPFFEEHGVSP